MQLPLRLAYALATSVAVALGFMATPSLAQTSSPAASWPQRAVRLIVPLPPGSGPDQTARLLAERLSERWRQPVVVENRAGADGINAATTFLSARDNHTLLFSFAGLITINPLIHDKLPYDPQGDFEPICIVADFFLAVAASPTLNVKSLDEFVTLVRSQPGKLNWASSSGIPRYVFASLLKSAALDMAEVAYRDFNQGALPDLSQGRIQAAATGLPSILPLVQTGSAKLLVLPNRERSPLAPDVPTAREAGYPDLAFDAVVGLFGWRAMPADLKRRIAADVYAVASDPTINARLKDIGIVVRLGSAEEFAAAIEDQRAKIAAIHQATAKPAQ
jgi:tripartite-type tricarboxylate transporter receptor subunit TctC